MESDSIRHRLRRGRLHRVHRGVYAVGRPEMTRLGWLTAAVLAAGDGAALSHGSAAELWGIASSTARIHVTVRPSRKPKPRGITVHRRALPGGQVTRLIGIAVTSVACTLVDLAAQLAPGRLERAVNEADRLDLIDPESLREALGGFAQRPGVSALRRLLDRSTFTPTDSELERRFKPIARAAGLPPPETGRWVSGFRVDFFWPQLGLVVETDGLRYHRTPAQQARDNLRDQAHHSNELIPLRFSHAQVAKTPAEVKATLTAVAARLAADSG